MSAKISCFVCQQLTETFLHARGSAPLISAEHVSAAHSHEAGELKTHIFWLVFRNNHVGVNYQFFQASDVIRVGPKPSTAANPSLSTRWQEI